MVLYEVDPALDPAERKPQVLDDGFSARVSPPCESESGNRAGPAPQPDYALTCKSDF